MPVLYIAFALSALYSPWRQDYLEGHVVTGGLLGEHRLSVREVMWMI